MFDDEERVGQIAVELYGYCPSTAAVWLDQVSAAYPQLSGEADRVRSILNLSAYNPPATGVSPPTSEVGQEVSITKCTQAVNGRINGKLSIKNTSSKTTSYIVTVAVNDDGGVKVAEMVGSTSSLKAGGEAELEVTGYKHFGKSPGTALNCEIAEVLVSRS